MIQQKLQPVRGTRDILADVLYVHNSIVDLARSKGLNYGCQEILTPIFEQSEVFHRTLGESSDIVSKETYTFLDRDKKSITLRPEFTAAIVRAFISNGFMQSIPMRLFSSGPIFRHERPQHCRFRQFHQINFEFFGVTTPASDCELIALAYDFLDGLGLLADVTLEINSIGDQKSRMHYKTALVKYLEKYENMLSADSKIRLIKNPLRILDSKNIDDKNILSDAPKMLDYLTEESRCYYDNVLKGLDSLNIRYVLNDKLVRGMDYYTHTVFEFTTDKLGSQGSVIAGGRYDSLVMMMGGSNIPAIGFAAGIERLAELVDPTKFHFKRDPIFALIPIGLKAESLAPILAHKIRRHNICINLDFQTTLKKRMQRANKIGAEGCMVFGDEELERNICKFKNMHTGKEEEVNIDFLHTYIIQHYLKNNT